MSIQADIMIAIAGVAGGNVRSNYMEEGVKPPLVVVRRTDYEPTMLLSGPAGFAKSTFVFECWGAKVEGVSTAKANALAIAADIKAAMAAQPLTFKRFQEPVTGEEFDPAMLEVMEPLQYSFWHDD